MSTLLLKRMYALPVLLLSPAGWFQSWPSAVASPESQELFSLGWHLATWASAGLVAGTHGGRRSVELPLLAAASWWDGLSCLWGCAQIQYRSRGTNVGSVFRGSYTESCALSLCYCQGKFTEEIKVRCVKVLIFKHCLVWKVYLVFFLKKTNQTKNN